MIYKVETGIFTSRIDFETKLSELLEKSYVIVSSGYDSVNGWWFIVKAGFVRR